jgi:hypothetical protein
VTHSAGRRFSYFRQNLCHGGGLVAYEGQSVRAASPLANPNPSSLPFRESLFVNYQKPIVFILGTLSLSLAPFLGGSASAAIVVGGSELLTPAYAQQLQDWLGEGPIALTNIFTKATGDTSADFHAAADGQGRTFSVLEVLTVNGEVATQIIGGYNPQSWSSNAGWHLSPTNAERTAFLFNLSTTEKQDQKADGGYCPIAS